MLGGTQSLHTNSKDEALALPTEAAVRIALRTQQIVANESGVTNTIDPLGGSYYVESMTDQIERDAEEYIAKIDSQGGAAQAIENCFQQGEIQKAAYQYEKDVDSKKRIVVGVNKFTLEEPPPTNLLKIDMRVQTEQIKFLKQVKAERSNDEVLQKLAVLKTAAQGEANLMPLILDAVKVYASVGEICNTLREVFGEYKETVSI